jgi:hypothetical protein
MFDDANTGLYREPFVAGMSEIIDEITRHIPNAEKGVTILFSESYFPSAQGFLKFVKSEGNGNWYQYADMVGWLCPALFKYFNEAPKEIYYQAL